MSALGATRFDSRLREDPPRFRGRIRYVFTHAALVEPEGEGCWMTLLHPDRPLVPWGIEIPWDRMPLSADMTVSLEPSGLRAGDQQIQLLGPGRSLKVADLPPPPPRARLHRTLAALPLPERTRMLLGLSPIPEIDVPATGVVGELAGLLGKLLDLAMPSTPEPERGRAGVYPPPRGAPIRARRGINPRPTDGLARDSLGTLAESLCGLGPGATPSGDDVLVGVAAGLAALKMEGFGEVLHGLPLERTTLCGREMIRQAARGFFPEPLLLFLRSVLEDEEPGEAMRRLCFLGAQSGGDLLAGAVGALSAWSDNTEGGAT